MKKASSEILLLDVNVLLALAWPNHQFFAKARKRLASKNQQWATCALTQLGFVRLSSMPAVVSAMCSPSAAARMLEEMVEDPGHVYLSEQPSPATITSFERVLGPGQVTDAYLLALARFHRVRFLTFDGRLSSLASVDTTIEVLEP